MSASVTPTDDSSDGDQRRPRLGFHAARAAVGIAVAVVTYLLFPSSPAVDFALLEPGAVAPDNVIAPFAFKVPKTAAELTKERTELAATVEPIFRFVPEALDSARSTLARFADTVASATASTGNPADRAAALARNAAPLGVHLAPTEASYLLAPHHAAAMRQAVQRVIDRWLASGAAASGTLDDVGGVVTVRRGDVQHSVPADSALTFASLVARARLLHPDASSPVADAVYNKLLAAVFHPTLVYDRAATENARHALVASVRPDKYSVLPGEKIVGAHEVIGRPEYEKMRALRNELQLRGGTGRSVGRVVGSILFNALVVAVLGVALLLFRPRLYASMRAVLLFATLYAAVLAVASAIAHEPKVFHPELIPVALVGVTIGLLFDARISMIAAMVLAVLIGGQSEFRGTNALFVNLLGGAAAAVSVRAIARRAQTYYSIVAVAGAYLVAAVAIGLTLDQSLREIAHSVGWGALNAVVSVSLAMGLLPPAEEFAGVDTYFKLLEWSDLNRPLMRRLSLEAPGTFAHTIAIANLAETACNAIGANGLLARVGAYYHDIGKLKKPQYFAENQPRGRNPHDKLKPATSASIIRGHVREGMELADEYGVPRPIRAFIAEHHGTGSISYFLEKARERDGAVPTGTEYAYPGPVPQTAETAVCMLADGVEAAARVVNDPTPEKLREVIDRIVQQRIEQGQLRDAPLTLRQLTVVKEAFLRALMGMYHNRIDYPVASGGITSEFAVS